MRGDPGRAGAGRGDRAGQEHGDDRAAEADPTDVTARSPGSYPGPLVSGATFTGAPSRSVDRSPRITGSEPSNGLGAT